MVMDASGKIQIIMSFCIIILFSYRIRILYAYICDTTTYYYDIFYYLL